MVVMQSTSSLRRQIRQPYVALLRDAGFRLIEIGHGLGLGASGPRYGEAAATDEEYLRAAATTLKQAQFGTFFIPGIGTREHLHLARDYGMSFVRVGTNITESEQAEEYIKYAKKLGFKVSYNAMKSYAVSPQEFGRRIALTVEWGADLVYLVDSAGGMLPRDVTEYVSRLRENVEADIGFHGHNNFMLANANNLAALASGATYLDSTLRGMGRSSGNAQTEIMVVLLERLGYCTGIDRLQTLDAGERLIQPRMQPSCGIAALEVVTADAFFHSSFMPLIDRAVALYLVDAKALVMAVSKWDNIRPSEDLVMSVAAQLAREQSAVA